MTGFTDNWAGQNIVTFVFGAMFAAALIGKVVHGGIMLLDSWWRNTRLRAVNRKPALVRYAESQVGVPYHWVDR